MSRSERRQQNRHFVEMGKALRASIQSLPQLNAVPDLRHVIGDVKYYVTLTGAAFTKS